MKTKSSKSLRILRLFCKTDLNPIFGKKQSNPYLCSCELKDDIFLYMEKVEDISHNIEGIVKDWLPGRF